MRFLLYILFIFYLTNSCYADTYIESGTFTLNNDLIGNVFIAPGARLLVANGIHPAIIPIFENQTITVTNSGLIDLTSNLNGPSNTLTIVGNYIGNNGELKLNTTLAGDNSPSDVLIISRGTATGATHITIINVNGLGGLTTNNGILVVRAINGAITDDAFKLKIIVAAGPYEYLLYKGGTDPGTSENWYLRSALLLPQSSSSSSVVAIPTYRPEVPVYSSLQPVFYQSNLFLLGTFHERRGTQCLLLNSNMPDIWLRFLDRENNQTWSGTVSPQFNGSIRGLQIGADLLKREFIQNHKDVAGIIAGLTYLQGNIKGFALAEQNYRSGNLNFNGKSMGAYWTHIGPTDWYLDGVLLNTWYKGQAKSFRGYGIDVNQASFAASLEGGYPFPLTACFILEPQAQILWQTTPSDHTSDTFSTVKVGTTQGWSGRIGSRLQANFDLNAHLLQPYINANLWHNFSNQNTVTFAGTPITTQNQSSALQLGGGVVYAFNKVISAFAGGAYAVNVDAKRQRLVSGNAGLQAIL